MSAPSQSEARRGITDVSVGAMIGIASIFAIDWYAGLLKDQDPLNNQDTRLALTIAFFGVLLGLAYLLLGPRRRAVAAVMEWMYDEAPPHTAQAARRWAHALDQLVSATVIIIGGFVAATAVQVLALWYPVLNLLLGPAVLLWWGCLIAALLLPFTGGFLFSAVYQQYLELRERDQISQGFQPRGWAELFTPTDASAPTPLAIRDGHRFAAGGVEWGWRELRTGCIVFGQPGSGKTACVLNTMLEGLIGSAHRAGIAPGGLILDPKGDFEGKLRTLLIRYGWEHRLRVIDPTRPARSERWNPLDSADDELELAGRFAAVMEAVGQRAGDNTFWVDAAKKFVRHAIALVRATNNGIPPAVTDLVVLATNPEALAKRADLLDPHSDADHACLAFFADEWTGLAEETRTSVVAYVTNMLDPFTVDPYRSLFSGRSTVRLADALREGQIVYLRMPVAEKEVMARTVGTFLKLEFYREVLRAVNKERPSLFMCDEFQVFMTVGQGKGDAEFFERSRQSNHVNLIATQNLPALTRTTPNAREPAMSLLGNCATKVFLRNTDAETNKFGSELFGQEVVTVGGRGVSAAAGRTKVLTVNTTAQDQNDQVVRPERFTELAVPVPPSVTYCEAIIHAAGSASKPSRRRTRWPLHPLS